MCLMSRTVANKYPYLKLSYSKLAGIKYTDIENQPLLWEMNHGYGTYIFENKHGYMKTTVTTGLATVRYF